MSKRVNSKPSRHFAKGPRLLNGVTSTILRLGIHSRFLLQNSERVKNHAIAMAKKHGRPFRYLASNIDKDGTARQLAARDGIRHGLICIFSILEPCRSFSFLFKKPLPDQRPFVKSARRKYLHLYFYFMDRHFGLIHVRIQTWFPMPIRVYLNGHEWLARKLEANGVRFTKHDNAFLWIENMVRAQQFSDRFANLNWPKMVDKSGLVLRVETVINNPGEFKVRKKVIRKGKSKVEWVTMRKGVAYLFRYREVSWQANSRYLEALAAVDDPTKAKRDLDRMATRKQDTPGRGCSGFNSLVRRDAELFQSVMDGDHCLRGFTNKNIRARLASTPHLRKCGNQSKKASAKISRILRRFRTHGLIAKIPHQSSQKHLA